jgi:hypothetical protein
MWKNKLIPFAAGKFLAQGCNLWKSGYFVLYSQTTGLICSVMVTETEAFRPAALT